MKILIKIVFILSVISNSFVTSKSFAQINLNQSDSKIKWLEIGTDNFKVIFPDYLEKRAQYTLNLLEHYKPTVSENYQSPDKKLTVIVRPDMAAPNGFVTLAPRRTEWFNNASITPFVGSLEWFQSLAIHEYRHVVQYDYLSQGNTKWGYYLFGEGFLGFLVNIVMPTWYFEGDAVWAETVMSDAGRGRSPRFSARLKALITSGKFPTYDELLAGNFTTNLPNYYVYGYFLISRANNVYGEDVWRKIAKEASMQPWNVYVLYSSFKKITGKDFDEFYNDTLNELKVSWDTTSTDFNEADLNPFSNSFYPISDNGEEYYLKKSLSTHWTLFNSNGPIKELHISPSRSKVDIKNSQLVFSQNIPHSRFLYKGFSDLFVYDIQLDLMKRLSIGKRFYHPQFSFDSSKILAIEFGRNDNFNATILNRNGEVIKRIFPKKEYRLSEAVWISESMIAAISIATSGKKQIVTYDIRTDELIELTPSTRNNLYNLNFKDDSIYFEADYQGKVNIFKFHIVDNTISQCTDEFISALMPYVSEKLQYVYESNNGKKVRKVDLDCILRDPNNPSIFDISHYIGNSPSDNYTQAVPVEISDYDQFYKMSKSPKAHPESSGSLNPHSWAFIGDRGFQLSGTSANNLGTLALNAYTGMSAEEGAPFAGISFNYMKFYPIFGFQFDYANREKEISPREKSNWSETKANLSITLPHIYQNHLYGGIHLLKFDTGIITASNNEYVSSTKLNDNRLLTNTIRLSSSFQKALTKTEIFPRWGALFTAIYTDIKKQEDSETNYYTQISSTFNTPGFMLNHGFEFSFTTERRPRNQLLYNLQANYKPLVGYTLSRGFNLEFTPEFSKATIDYALPVFYPNTGISDWLYITRIYAKIFSDHTSFLNSNNDFQALNSTGIEFIFNTNTLRKFPLSYGLRLMQVNKPEVKNHFDFFLATQFD